MKETVALLVLILLFVECRAQDWHSLHMSMIDEIQRDMKTYTGQPLSAPVEQALKAVSRHDFVPGHLASSAYDNRPLPIGNDQTISQPFIVALMTELLALGPDDQVLEVGTGSGYQAAVLAEICDRVFTIEIISALATEATKRLQRLGYDNVLVRHGDGTKGWPEHGPFDGIIVTAAGLDIPDALLEQLKPGGRLVMPVGSVYSVQQLKVIEKTEQGFDERDVLSVRFVPITHDVR